MILTTESQLVAAGTVYVSGEIPRVTPFERGLPGQHRRTLDGTGWEPDEEIRDERFLAVNVAGANEAIIPDTVAALREFDLAVIAAGHCTGWRAMTALANAFGDQRLVPL